MGHCAITPPLSPAAVAAENDCSIHALQVCEDARVHWFLERAGINRLAGGLTDEEIASMAPRLAADPLALAGALVSTFSVGDHHRLDAAVSIAVDAGQRTAGAPRPAGTPEPMDERTFREVQRGARLVVQAVRREQTRGKHPSATRRGFMRNTVPAARLFDSLFGSGGTVEQMSERSDEGETLRRVFGDGSSEIHPWGTIESIDKLPVLTPRQAGKRHGRGRTYRDEGAMPNAMHRWAVDGRIFKRWRPAPGGTVLVDMSGSMSLSADDLREIVLAAPAATVAMYSGRSTRGRITIVARRGKVASERDMNRARAGAGGGNIIDGPALRWLAGQPGPRVWVSDGYVTGQHDKFARNLIAEAFAIVKRSGIHRVGRADRVAGMIADLNRRPV
jgi:hypothetical protein